MKSLNLDLNDKKIILQKPRGGMAGHIYPADQPWSTLNFIKFTLKSSSYHVRVLELNNYLLIPIDSELTSENIFSMGYSITPRWVIPFSYKLLNSSLTCGMSTKLSKTEL